MSRNVLILMSDQHAPGVSGAYGNSAAKTPNLDVLAKGGVRFDAAYTNSPICVPARAAMATGRYVHRTGNWDNASPYVGTEADSWGHRVAASGRHVITFGKLHFRRVQDPTGYDDQRSPLHVRDGLGDLLHALRGDQPPSRTLRQAVLDVIAGESDYTGFDREVARQAADWLTGDSACRETPWVGMVSFATPHYPFTVPQEYLDRHPDDSLPMPTRSDPECWDRHPALEWYRKACGFDDPLTDEETIRAVRTYYALVSFMDDQIGVVLRALESSRHANDTVIIYTSDHGELCGTDGLWFKGTMQEPSVRIPMLVNGPGVPSGKTCHTAVSLVDVFPTVVDALGLDPDPRDTDLPGASLLRIANETDDPDRVVFSEYHSANSRAGSFMVRSGRWKYVHHPEFPPQLFDLVSDPSESANLADDPAYSAQLMRCQGLLMAICDPDETDRRVRESQRRRVDEYGGVEAVRNGFPLMAFSPVPKR